VLVVGEILPSAYFTGRDQLTSASKLIPVLRFVIVITSPISYPLAKLMDHYFHPAAESSGIKRGEVTAMVRIQYEEHLAWKKRNTEHDTTTKYRSRSEPNLVMAGWSDAETVLSATTIASTDTAAFCTPCEPLTYQQDAEFNACVIPYRPDNRCISAGICNVPSYSNSLQQNLSDDDIIKLEGALSLKDKQVKCAYTPLNRVVSIMADTILDENMVVQIYSHGYSRIPVLQYIDDKPDDTTTAIARPTGICGIVLTKQLMLIGKEDRRRVSSLTLYEPPCVSPQASLAEALNIILTGKRKSSNMALVCTDPDIATTALRNMKPIPVEAGVLGIITLENVLEELIQEPILDEKDKKMSQQHERAKWAIAKWKAFVVRKRANTERENVELGNDQQFDYISLNELV
jgi:metal transporter CNNM